MSPTNPSSRPRGFFRAWTVLLALFLPFALVFATPTTAAAAESMWGSTTVQMSGMTPDGNCYIAAAYDGAERVQWANGSCWGSMDITPFSGQFAEAGSQVRLTFNGATSDGGYCGAVSGDMTLGDHSDDGVLVAGSIPDGSFGLTGAGDCDVLEVCVSLNGGGAAWITDCAPINLPPPSVGGECPNGSLVYANGYVDNYRSEIWANRYFTPHLFLTLDGVKAGTSWHWIAVFKDQNGGWRRWDGVYDGRTTDYLGFDVDQYSEGRQFTLAGVQVFQVGGDVELMYQNATDPAYAWEDPASQIRTAAGTQANFVSYWKTPQDYTPSALDVGLLGTSDPQVCRFWAGNTAFATVDTPHTGTDQTAPSIPLDGGGGGGSEPAPSPSKEVDEPVADEPSFWELMKKLLREIFSAVAGIPGKIAGLFMPDAGYLNAKGREMKEAWEDTAPGQYVTAFKGLSVGAGVSGCGGIAFDPPLRDVALETTYIGAACSGKMADAAALVRLGISAAVVIGGGLACVKALGSGFGWNPNVGGKGGEA